MNVLNFLPGNIDWMFILFQCPFFSLLGSVAHICKLNYNLTHLEDTTKAPMTALVQEGKGYLELIMKPLEHTWNRCGWIVSRLFIGYISGVLVGLYFLAEMQHTERLMLKIFGLCIFIGALAPHLWSSQERFIEHYVSKTICSYFPSQSLVNKHIKEHREDTVKNENSKDHNLIKPYQEINNKEAQP